MHGLTRALTSSLILIAAVAAGCTSNEDGTGDTTISGTGTESGSEDGGDGDLPPICDGEEPGPDIIVNSPDDLDQFLGIECIPGKLLIDASAEELLNLQGLETVKEIGTLEVRSQLTLTSLSGLENVRRIGTVLITASKALPDFAKLESLETIDNSLSIISNDALVSLTGLEGLTDVPVIHIKSNPLLEDYSGLNELTGVKKLEIIENETPTDMTGFTKLEEVRGELTIKGNVSLTTLDGFTLLQTVGDIIEINGNSELPTCVAEAWADAIPDKGAAVIIHDNKTDTCG